MALAGEAPDPRAPPDPRDSHRSALRVAVAFSGGRDSTVLLHAVCQVARRSPPLEVVALHVDHGLQPGSSGWAARLERRVRGWRRLGWPVQFRHQRLDGHPPGGSSLEAWAREGRYRLLGEMAQSAGCEAVLLAHHRRDQAETFCLQALRGAGPAGLASMPVARSGGGLRWLRPFLDRSADELESYARVHRLRWIHDPSNDDPQLARNRLRLAVWPALSRAFPQAEAALAASARFQQQAAELIAEIAAADLPGLLGPHGGVLRERWLALSPARRRGVLAHWLDLEAPRAATRRLQQRLLDEWPSARPGSIWPVDGGWLLLHRGELRHCRAQPTAVADDPPGAPLPHRTPQCLPLPALPASELAAVSGHWDLPAFGGRLHWRRLGNAGSSGEGTRPEPGLPLDALRGAELRARQGGERFQAGDAQPARSLKKQFQARGVHRLQRDGPLLWHGDRLLWVAALGPDARALSDGPGPRYALDWEPWPVTAMEGPLMKGG